MDWNTSVLESSGDTLVARTLPPPEYRNSYKHMCGVNPSSWYVAVLRVQ